MLSLKVLQDTLAVAALVKTKLDIVSTVVALEKRVVEIMRPLSF
jgi:hypothetical protein